MVSASVATAKFVHERPLRVYWEITRACDLACRHCRATANPNADPDELSTAEGFRLLEQLASFGEPYPHVVLTGGDPLKRRDLFKLIDAARGLGLRVSVAPSATPLLTEKALLKLASAGIDAISLSLDGSTAERHDAIRGIAGTYGRTLEAAHVARVIHLPFQINTLVCADTVDDLPSIYQQVCALGAARWSLFFLVTVGRGQLLQPISAARAEQVLQWAAGLVRRPGTPAPIITSTEAPQLRRVAMQQSGGSGAHHAAGIRDGNGIIFISHTGDICPSGFLEVAAGNIRARTVVDVYRDAPLFVQLRDPDSFHGRCGRCEYRWACGGSRARAYCASGGDALAEDPLCEYESVG
ncbi:MAG TPA: radical SAM protein [Vicinamibacterales bacterium]|jgi:radical SAM protein with 4Fe4S-binding SPASM domain|nr:radical SAM protein [Vicinamibacterales bacterium]